jgi:SAM-dependent methyltransferase
MHETVSAANAPDAPPGAPHSQATRRLTGAARQRESAALSRRLRKLERVFPVAAIQGQPLGAQQVVDYYEHCHDAYRKYHSAEGAVHMALNDGDAFDPDGFYGQLRRMERDWTEAARSPADVLELAFGQGFNLGYLAARHPACRFSGIDLTPSHLQLAGQRLQGLANTALTLGDFHHLPYGDESFDQMFCIEAFCYASDLARAFAEAARVLRPGGCFTLFDGYLPRLPALLQPHEALAVDLVAKGMAIPQLQGVDELLASAAQAGFAARAVTSLDAQVLPSLLRLQRVTGAVIRWPWLGRLALARRHPMRGRNVLAGYLMHSTVVLGLIGYRHIVLQKKS